MVSGTNSILRAAPWFPSLRAYNHATAVLLFTLPIALSAPLCIGRSNDGAGWACRREFGGHRVLDLHGTDTAIGQMYGELFRDELKSTYVPMVDGMLDALPVPFRRAFEFHEQHFSGFFSPEMDARAAGVEAAVGLPSGAMRRYAWLSELGSIGPALNVATSGAPQLDGLTGRPTGGCTSFIAQNEQQTVHARNVDFWGMEYWQPNATLVFVEPLDEHGKPDGFRYASVSDLGEIFAGTTGINERGLVITTHLNVSRDVVLLGGKLHLSPVSLLSRAVFGPPNQPQVSVLRVVETVLRRAETVKDAVSLIAEFRTAGAWSFMLSDPGGGRAVVGINARDQTATHGAQVLTNLYPDAAMHQRELIPARGPVEGARLRYERASALVAAHAADMDVSRAAAILRDRYDSASGEVRLASANSVLSPDASQSIVFVTSQGGDPTLWVAFPHANGLTPAPLAPYFSMPFWAGFDPVGCPNGCLGGELRYEPDPLDESATAYARAISRRVDYDDDAGALAILRAIAGDDAGIHLMAAWLAASLDQDSVAADELALASGASKLMSVHHQILAAYLAGSLARRAGNEGMARAHYQSAMSLIERDGGVNADLNALLLPVLESRLRTGRHRRETLPAPDLKFQDVFGLSVD